MTTTALARARAGDGDAFGELTEPYRRELQLHCYRILGSVQDAEDTLQETLLAAWRGIGRFEEQASVRTWLYKIATNRCLNALRDTGRRPAAAARHQWSDPPPEPTRRSEPLWLQPYPDTRRGTNEVPHCAQSQISPIGPCYAWHVRPCRTQRRGNRRDRRLAAKHRLEPRGGARARRRAMVT